MTASTTTTTTTTTTTSTATTASSTPPPGVPFALVALDLDGTLLGADHQLSETTTAGLRKLHAQGLRLILATGRVISTVTEHIVALGLPEIDVVCTNGSTAFTCRLLDDSKVQLTPLFATTVPADVARATLQLAADYPDAVVQYYVNDAIYANPSTTVHRALTEEYKKLTGARTIYVEPASFPSTVLAQGEATKMLVLFPPEQQDHMCERFQQDLPAVDGHAPTLIRGNLGWFLEVLTPGVHKGAGLQRYVTQHLQWSDMSRVVAFGDGDNDIDFLRMSGWGIVMRNGREVTKAVADQMTHYTNAEDGVIRTLEEMNQQGWLVRHEEEDSRRGLALSSS